MYRAHVTVGEGGVDDVEGLRDAMPHVRAPFVAPGPARLRARARSTAARRAASHALHARIDDRAEHATQPRSARRAYARLLAAHHGLDDAQSAKVIASLLLANHIGDTHVIDEAIAAAREDVVTESTR